MVKVWLHLKQRHRVCIEVDHVHIQECLSVYVHLRVVKPVVLATVFLKERAPVPLVTALCAVREAEASLEGVVYSMDHLSYRLSA